MTNPSYYKKGFLPDGSQYRWPTGDEAPPEYNPSVPGNPWYEAPPGPPYVPAAAVGAGAASYPFWGAGGSAVLGGNAAMGASGNLGLQNYPGYHPYGSGFNTPYPDQGAAAAFAYLANAFSNEWSKFWAMFYGSDWLTGDDAFALVTSLNPGYDMSGWTLGCTVPFIPPVGSQKMGIFPAPAGRPGTGSGACGSGPFNSSNAAWGEAIPSGTQRVQFTYRHDFDFPYPPNQSGIIQSLYTYPGTGSPSATPYVPPHPSVPVPVEDPFPDKVPFRYMPYQNDFPEVTGMLGGYGGFGPPGRPPYGGLPSATPDLGGGPPHVNRPPGEGEKERKKSFGDRSKAYRLAWGLAQTGGNLKRYTRAIYNSLPKSLRKHGYVSEQDMLKAIYRNADAINIGSAAKNMLKQMAKDRIFGKLARTQAESIRSNPYWNSPQGFTFGGRYRPGVPQHYSRGGWNF